jgi:hypothetical protein
LSAKLPYLASPGTVKTVLDKIIEARTPERFTQDFLETKLGAKGGSARAIIPLLKRVGMLEQAGSPTELYRKFRNTETSGAAMAMAIRHGYAELFERNEYAHELGKPKLLELINEISGNEKGNSADNFTASTFMNLKEYADFDMLLDEDEKPTATTAIPQAPLNDALAHAAQPTATRQGRGEGPLTLAYSINLHLPETDDIKVFDAIFQSLNNNILKRTDG